MRIGNMEKLAKVKAVSKKQWRMLQAILHGKGGSHPRGLMPKSVAAKYSAPDSDAPESKNNDHGGSWDNHKSKHSKNKKHKKLNKNMDLTPNSLYGVGVIVSEDDKILLGFKRSINKYVTPGGHVEPGENGSQAAIRELREETGLEANNMWELQIFTDNTAVYLCTDYAGVPKTQPDFEIDSLKFVDIDQISKYEIVDYSLRGIVAFLAKRVENSKCAKSAKAINTLEKNIMRGTNGQTATYEMTHGDALKLVGNGLFRKLREQTKDMKEEDFKNIYLDNYIINIRKHLNDVYSGNVSDGHKNIHHFTNMSLPHLTGDLMSVFEWYMPEDMPIIDMLNDEFVTDDEIKNKLSNLSEDYKRNNLANIYSEMETIRTEIRNGNAVDLQQVEQRMMKLFDKLNAFMTEVASKHNSLANQASSEIENLECKLLELQQRIDEFSKQPTVMSAIGDPQNIRNAGQIQNNFYPYLTKPKITINPDGQIKITFGPDWMPEEGENFVKDLRMKVVAKSKQLDA